MLEYLDVPNPAPSPGRLVIETAAIAVNFPDIRERLGVYDRPELVGNALRFLADGIKTEQMRRTGGWKAARCAASLF